MLVPLCIEAVLLEHPLQPSVRLGQVSERRVARLHGFDKRDPLLFF
jgi:hypothetical protein